MHHNRQENEHLASVLRDFDPAKLVERVTRYGEDWAEQNAAAAALEESRKSLLAKLTLEYQQGATSGGAGEKPRPMPVSQAELRALADVRYETHIEMMVQARNEAHRARVRYDMGQMELELMRSRFATLRQEMRFAGMAT